MFEYKFELGTVKYDENTKDIIAYMNNGEEKRYGDPFAGASDGGKSRVAINGCKNPEFKPVCSPYTAAAHTRCIEAVQTFPIHDVKPEFIKAEGSLLYVDGLYEVMEKCYKDEIMLDETEQFERWTK